MKKTKKQTLLARVSAATQEVTDAATALQTLMTDLKVAPRAEKTKISQIAEEAFTRLNSARSALSDVEKILAQEPDE